MQFQVPQYIDVEDHIVGPLTLRQFLYIATGFLLIFISFFYMDKILWIPFSIVVAAVSLSLALVKYNGRPLLSAAIAAFSYFTKPKSYIWQKPATGTGTQAPPKKQGLIARLGLELLAGTKPVLGRERATGIFFRRSLPASESVAVLRDITGNQEDVKRVDYR